MFVPVTADKLSREPDAQGEEKFFSCLRAQAKDDLGINPEEKLGPVAAGVFIRESQEELNAFIDWLGQPYFAWDATQHIYYLRRAAVDDQLTQQETSDLFKMKAVKLSIQASALSEEFPEYEVKDNTIITRDAATQKEITSLEAKAELYIQIGEELSLRPDNWQMRYMA